MGQCGNQIGSALWPLILQEYGIGYDRIVKQGLHPSFNSFFYIPEGSNFDNIKNFNDIKKSKVKARVLNIFR